MGEMDTIEKRGIPTGGNFIDIGSNAYYVFKVNY